MSNSNNNQRNNKRQQGQQPMPMPVPQTAADANPMPQPMPKPVKQNSNPMPAPQPQPNQGKQAGNANQPGQQQNQNNATMVGQNSDAQMNTRLMANLQHIMGPPAMVAQRSNSHKQRNQSQGAHGHGNRDSRSQGPHNRNDQRQQQLQQKERLPSLHFGNLPEQFYDLDLFKFIKNAGHRVHKAFVVQDKKTQKNAKYGYAQFLTLDEAKKCLDDLNNAAIEGTVITVSMQVTSKPNPKANVFVRNLPTKMTQQEIFELYSKYGIVVKCKLECYADNTSRGFAYVQFQEEKDATSAIAATNSMEIQGKKLEVFAHEKKSTTKTASSSNAENNAGQANAASSADQGKFTNNIFVQGLPRGTDEQSLKKLFEPFGTINSALVQSADSEDPMSNNGFVCFSEAADAMTAMNGMHKKKIDSKDNKSIFLLVQPHVAKRENDMSIDKTRAPIQQNMKKCFDSNLFVRNIPADTEQSVIEAAFGAFGTIISIKIKNKKNSNISNLQSRFKYAFVLYETVDMAQNAIRCLDQTRPFGLTPIEVEFWVSRVDLQQEREERQKQEMKRLIQSGLNDLQAQFLGHPAGHHGGQHHGHQGGFRNRGRGQATGRGGRPQTGGNMQRNPNHNRDNQQHRQRSQNNRQGRQQSQNNNRNQGQNQNNSNQQQNNKAQAAQYTAQAPTADQTQSQDDDFTVSLPQIDQTHLNSIQDPNERKQLIGNAIYSAVQPHVHDFAGKITGMLLDENVVDMSRLCNDQKYLSDLVNEAWRLLRSQTQMPQPMPQAAGQQTA